MHRQRGTFSLEYAFLIAVVVVALAGMSGYFYRSLCGKWRAVGDTFGFGRQYGEDITPKPPPPPPTLKWKVTISRLPFGACEGKVNSCSSSPPTVGSTCSAGTPSCFICFTTGSLAGGDELRVYECAE